MTHAARFTVVLVGVVRVRYGTNGGHTFLTYQTQFARRQSDLSVSTITAYELGVGTGSTSDLAALAWLHFDVVNDRTDRHAREWHSVPRLDVGLGRSNHLVANSNTLRSKDVSLFAIFVLDQCDECGPVRVIFDPCDNRGHVQLVALEIDDTVKALCPTACATHCDPSGVVPSA